jgi:hypothetical protein
MVPLVGGDVPVGDGIPPEVGMGGSVGGGVGHMSEQSGALGLTEVTGSLVSGHEVPANMSNAETPKGR